MSVLKTKKAKNPKLKALENKVFELQNKLEEAQVAQAYTVDLATLSRIAVGLRYNKEKALYFIDVIKYDEVTGVGRLQDSLPAGDSLTRARFELQKFVAKV
jgi:hypothetical protein